MSQSALIQALILSAFFIFFFYMWKSNVKYSFFYKHICNRKGQILPAFDTFCCITCAYLHALRMHYNMHVILCHIQPPLLVLQCISDLLELSCLTSVDPPRQFTLCIVQFCLITHIISTHTMLTQIALFFLLVLHSNPSGLVCIQALMHLQPSQQGTFLMVLQLVLRPKRDGDSHGDKHFGHQLIRNTPCIHDTIIGQIIAMCSWATAAGCSRDEFIKTSVDERPVHSTPSVPQRDCPSSFNEPSHQVMAESPPISRNVSIWWRVPIYKQIVDIYRQRNTSLIKCVYCGQTIVSEIEGNLFSGVFESCVLSLSVWPLQCSRYKILALGSMQKNKTKKKWNKPRGLLQDVLNV